MPALNARRRRSQRGAELHFGLKPKVAGLPARSRTAWEPLRQPAEPAGVDDVDNDQRAAIIEVEQAELGGGEVQRVPLRVSRP